MMKLALATCLIALTGLPSSATAQKHDTVWVWNARCPSPTHIMIRVRLDQRTIYNGLMPICRWERQFEKGKASFRFTPGRPVVWYGYRSDAEDGRPDPGDTTAAETPLEIDFWQAGGDSSAVELGYLASAPDGLHMNAIHLVSPGRHTATTMAPGLVLDTWPVAKP